MAFSSIHQETDQLVVDSGGPGFHLEIAQHADGMLNHEYRMMRRTEGFSFRPGQYLKLRSDRGHGQHSPFFELDAVVDTPRRTRPSIA